MKKHYLLLSVFILGVNLMFAQLPSLDFGVKIGVNSTKLSASAKEDFTSLSTDAHNGLLAGAYLRISHKKLFLQPEAYFATKISNINYTDINNQNISQKINLTTMDVPILIGYYLIKFPEFKIRVCAGPAFSYILDKNLSNVDVGTLQKSDLKDAVWNAQAGAGIDLFMFTLDVRYELGLNNFTTSPNLDKLRNNLLFVSLGYKIF